MFSSSDRPRPPSWRSPRLKTGELLWRAAACRVKAARGDDPLEDYRGDEQFPLLERAIEIISRSAVSPGSLATSGWASELAASIGRAFIAGLQPSAFAALSGITSGFDLDSSRELPRVIARSSSPSMNGSFTGEGQPIPVRRLGLASIVLTPKKMAVISEFTNELMKASVANVEQILRREIQRDSAVAIDTALVDSTAADSVRPAGLLAAANVPGSIAPSAATASYDKMVADLKALIASIGSTARPVLLANPAQSLSLGWVSASETGLGALTVITSPTVPAGKPIMVDADSFAWASGAPQIELQKVGVIHEEDTTPLPISATGTPNTVAAPSRSVWQTDSWSIRMVMPLTWTMTRSGGVATFSSNVGW